MNTVRITRTITSSAILAAAITGCVSSNMKTVLQDHPGLSPSSLKVAAWGKPQVVQGKHGKAVKVWAGNAATLELAWPASGCLEFWYKTPEHFDKFECVMWGPDAVILNHCHQDLGAWEPTGWRFALWSGSTWIQTDRVGGRPVENTWYHVAAVWDETAVYLYINGKPLGSTKGRVHPTGNPVYVGIEPAVVTPTQWGSPKVFDEVRLWKLQAKQLPLLAGE